jgi:vacuolar protein sorting-associated protein 13A/C
MTSAFIELAITSITVWSKHGERIQTERGSDAPFRVRNRTGYSLLVWSDLGNGSKPKDSSEVTQLEDDADIPWRFEDRKQMREVGDQDVQLELD